MLQNLTIENFRSFEKYQLNGLTRVNLLVGDNNCGKTSVLEAVNLLVTGGDRGHLVRILELREDIAFSKDTQSSLATTKYVASSLIYKNQEFDLFEDHHTDPVVRTTGRHEGHEEIDDRRDQLEMVFKRKIQQLTTRLRRADQTASSQNIRTDASGRIDYHPIQKLTGKSSSGACFFVPPGGMQTEEIAWMWERILKRKYEHLAVSAMQVVDPNIRQIILSPDTVYRRDILIDRGEQRITLAELGGGIYSLLSLGCALAYTAGGTLILDEIDTGLHYSRMADMWKMVIETSRELNVQVFATTHSQDCIRALAECVAAQPGYEPETAILRIDRTTSEAVRFAGEELRVVVDHEIEVR